MERNKFLVFCFAFVPGAGQMYLGMMKKGLVDRIEFNISIRHNKIMSIK